MSASPRTIQGTQGIRNTRAALAAVGAAIALAVVLAIGLVMAPKAQTAPAAGAAPVTFDHGSATWTTNDLVVPGTTGGGIRYTGIPYPAPGSAHGAGGANHNSLPR